MKTIVLIFFLILVILSVVAVMLMLVSALNRAFKRKTDKKRAEVRSRMFPPRMLAEYYGGIRKATGSKNTELFEKGLLHKRKEEFQPAIKLFQECLNDNPTREHKIGIYVTLGNCHFALQELSRAQSCYQKAETLSIESDDGTGRLACTINLGLTCAAEKRWSEAIGNYHRVVDLDREFNQLAGEAIDLNTLGLLYQTSGDPKSALRHYRQSLAIFQKLNDHKKARLVEDNIRSLGILDSK